MSEEGNFSHDLIKVSADLLEAVHRQKTGGQGHAGPRTSPAAAAGGLLGLAREATQLGIGTLSSVLELHARYAGVVADAMCASNLLPSAYRPSPQLKKLEGTLGSELSDELILHNEGLTAARFSMRLSEVRPISFEGPAFRSGVYFQPEAPHVEAGALAAVIMRIPLKAPFAPGSFQFELEVTYRGLTLHRFLYILSVAASS